MRKDRKNRFSNRLSASRARTRRNNLRVERFDLRQESLQELELREPFLHSRVGGVHLIRLSHVGISRVPFVQTKESNCARHTAPGRILCSDCLRSIIGVVFPALLRRA